MYLLFLITPLALLAGLLGMNVVERRVDRRVVRLPQSSVHGLSEVAAEPLPAAPIVAATGAAGVITVASAAGLARLGNSGDPHEAVESSMPA